VPLRLAITDAVDDPQLLAALPGGGRLWQDRLAGKLLAIAAQGADSPWHPYIQVRGMGCSHTFLNTFLLDAHTHSGRN
jgi:hypothetical protein